MGRKAKPRSDLTEADRSRALSRDLSAYMRGPSHVDAELEALERELEEAVEGGELRAVRGLSERETLCLHIALRRGRDSLRIMRELAVETFRLPGMPELARRRRLETLAANYEALRAGGELGDGVVTLRSPDEALLGVRGTVDRKNYGGPLSPRDACKALVEWSGDPYGAIREQLRDAREVLDGPDDPKIGDLPPGRAAEG